MLMRVLAIDYALTFVEYNCSSCGVRMHSNISTRVKIDFYQYKVSVRVPKFSFCTDFLLVLHTLLLVLHPGMKFLIMYNSGGGTKEERERILRVRVSISTDLFWTETYEYQSLCNDRE